MVTTLEATASSTQALVTLIRTPVADTTLVSSWPDANDGAAPSIYVGRDARGGVRRALLRFDVSDLPSSERAMLVRVRLTMRLTAVPGTAPAGSQLRLHRAVSSWVEGAGSNGSQGMPCSLSGGATWRTRDCLHPFVAAGGDALTTASAGADVTGRVIADDLVWDSADPGNEGLLQDVAAFRDDPCADRGWLVKSASEAVASTARGFGSREGPEKPRLEIDFVCLAGYAGPQCSPESDAGAEDAAFPVPDADDAGPTPLDASSSDAGSPRVCPDDLPDGDADAGAAADGGGGDASVQDADVGTDASLHCDAGDRPARASGCQVVEAGPRAASGSVWLAVAALVRLASRRRRLPRCAS